MRASIRLIRSGSGSGLRHEAFVYEGAEQLLARTVPFVEAGAAAGEDVMLLLPEPSRELLEPALAHLRGGGRLRFEAMEEVGRNPARLIPFWREHADRSRAAGRGLRGVGEPIWPGRDEAELEECRRHEALLDVAFADGPAWTLLCPFDAAGLGADARRPLADPAGIFAGELPPGPVAAAALAFDADELAAVREAVGAMAVAAGLTPERAELFVLAANEVATNSILHGGGCGELRVWLEAGAAICEVRDRGRFADSMVGRRRPRLDQAGGRGLWIANRVCDLVQIRSNEHGSAVRLRMRP